MEGRSASLGSAAIGLPLGENGFRFFASAGSPDPRRRLHHDSIDRFAAVICCSCSRAEPTPYFFFSLFFLSGREKGGSVCLARRSELGGLACLMSDDWVLVWLMVELMMRVVNLCRLFLGFTLHITLQTPRDVDAALTGVEVRQEV